MIPGCDPKRNISRLKRNVIRLVNEMRFGPDWFSFGNLRIQRSWFSQRKCRTTKSARCIDFQEKIMAFQTAKHQTKVNLRRWLQPSTKFQAIFLSITHYHAKTSSEMKPPNIYISNQAKITVLPFDILQLRYHTHINGKKPSNIWSHKKSPAGNTPSRKASEFCWPGGISCFFHPSTQ